MDPLVRLFFEDKFRAWKDDVAIVLEGGKVQKQRHRPLLAIPNSMASVHNTRRDLPNVAAPLPTAATPAIVFRRW